MRYAENEGSCWLVRLLFARWRRRRRGYNDGCQSGVIGRQYGVAANMSHLLYLGLRKMAAKYFEHTLANQSVAFYTL